MNGAGYTQGMDENIQVINPMDRSPPPRVDNRNEAQFFNEPGVGDVNPLQASEDFYEYLANDQGDMKEHES